MCEYITKEHPDFQYKTFIPCNLYGRWDKFSEQNSHMIPSVIKKVHQAIQSGVNNIEIWGDGTARREFMYASDLAAAAAKAIKEFDKVPDIMNIGLGYDFSINEYYETIKNILGYNGSFTHDISKPSGMKQKLLDITKQTEWGWKPSVSLQEGISKTYQFYLENNNDNKI
jgi:GDP-L-fucose synthase